MNQDHYDKVLNLMSNDYFEPGYISRSEEYMINIIKSDIQSAVNILNKIFIMYKDRPHYIEGILFIIAHNVDELIIFEQIQLIVKNCLCFKHIGVRDEAVTVLDNWDTIDSLNILKQLKYDEKWLQDYVDSIIKYREKIN